MHKIAYFLLFLTISAKSISNDVASVDEDDMPPYKEYAKVARYLVHKSDWTSAGTNSAKFPGFPMVNVVSMADSARGEKSTGLIYFFMTDLDFTGHDLNQDNKITVMFSQEQDLSCSSASKDPMEPTCARVIINGSRKKLANSTREYEFARNAFISRHPALKNWEQEHNFYLCKVEIEQVIVLDFYGGANYVTVEDYYRANYDWKRGDYNEIQGDDADSNKYREIFIKIDKNSNVKTIHIEV